jgi:hypothetical protein
LCGSLNKTSEKQIITAKEIVILLKAVLKFSEIYYSMFSEGFIQIVDKYVNKNPPIPNPEIVIPLTVPSLPGKNKSALNSIAEKRNPTPPPNETG